MYILYIFLFIYLFIFLFIYAAKISVLLTGHIYFWKVFSNWSWNGSEEGF